MAAKPRTRLIALGALTVGPLLSGGLVLAQSSPTADPSWQPTAPVAPLTPPPSVPPPVTTAPQAQAPVPVQRPTPEQSRTRPVARFDRSLDQLEREGVISPMERARAEQREVRVHSGLMPQLSTREQEACANGAISARECRSGVMLVDRSRPGASSTSEATALAAGGFSSGFRTDASPLPPISVPVSALLSGAGGSFRLTDVFGRTPRPAPIAGNGNMGLIFPLIGSAVTTSEFGWRLHPVVGSWLMHAGKDLAAPEGTPVVAALSGRVVMSGLAGGYGLAIELEHDNPRRRTLYGHLSELYVREGQMVRQGEVIGRVGSTGLSTGPHLHFELRLPQEGGWVAVDPGQLDPGGLFPGGQPGQPGGLPTDAVALLVGQLVQTLERPRSPLGNATAPRPGAPLPPQRNLPAPAPLPPRSQG